LTQKKLGLTEPWKLIKERYIEITQELSLQSTIRKELDALEKILLTQPDSLSIDFVVSRGEYLCAKIMAEFLGQNDEAVKWFGFMASFVPKVGFLPSNTNQAHANSLQFLAEHWNKIGQTALAIDILKVLKNFMLGTPHNPLALAEIYVANDKATEALDNLEFMKRELGDKPEFAFLYGQALALSGKVQEAVQIVSKAKQKFPKNSDIAELANAMGI
jgi:Aspartokinases